MLPFTTSSTRRSSVVKTTYFPHPGNHLQIYNHPNITYIASKILDIRHVRGANTDHKLVRAAIGCLIALDLYSLWKWYQHLLLMLSICGARKGHLDGETIYRRSMQIITPVIKEVYIHKIRELFKHKWERDAL